ncbi:MAG: hypothetical protein ACRD50_06055 [Candidatus Acidiferrales bacterium]
MLKRPPWARVVAILAGVIALFHVPLAAALGIYTLLVLLPNSAAQEVMSLARPQVSCVSESV